MPFRRYSPKKLTGYTVNTNRLGQLAASYMPSPLLAESLPEGANSVPLKALRQDLARVRAARP